MKKERLVLQADEALNTMRPYLKKDGGDLEILELTDDMILKIKLLGSCESCPMSMMTLRAGIEQAVINAVPEIRSVQATNIP